MKRSISIVLAVLMLLSVIAIAPLSVNAYTDGDFGYQKLSNGKARISDYYGKEGGKLVVPAKVGGLKVESIAARAFVEHKFSDVVISKGIKKIGNSAFEDCGIYTLKLPSTITTIEFDAFMSNNLEKVTLPEKALTLGKGVFTYCYKLKKVTLPKKLKKIPKRFFFCCKKLKSIKFPKTIKSIGDEAFTGTDSVTEIKFPAKLTKIGEKAFSDCKELSKIKFNEGLKTIGKEAFSDCMKIKKVSLPYSLKEIGDEAFGGCLYMTTITVPDGVTKIGTRAFGYYSEIFGDNDLMYFKNEQFTVNAYKGSEAAKYANENEFTLNEMKAPKKVKLNKKKLSLKVGKTKRLKATFKPKKATTLLKWKSSNKKIATVTQKGKVKAKKRGTATITVKTHNGKKATCKIKVI